MRITYRIFALLIALEVIVQAAAIAWGFFGLGKWIEAGNTLNKSVLDCRDCRPSFTEENGLMIHGINGSLIVPALGLLFLIVSFFTRNKTLMLWAAITFALVLIQAEVLPELASTYPIYGALHGVNALLVFSAAAIAWRKAKAPALVPPTA
jgi:hypothetical protein